MALAGIFLLLFLPIHLIVNLLLLQNQPEVYNKAAAFMATFPVIRVFEYILIISIIVHVIWAIYIQIQNWLARPVGYVSGNKAETSFFSKFMIWTGTIVLIFMVIHFFDFYFIRLGFVPGNAHDFYSVAYNLFKIPLYNYIYLVSFIILGLHLYHAFYSGFQTLGLNQDTWNSIVRPIALAYSFLIPFGFAYISLSIWLFR